MTQIAPRLHPDEHLLQEYWRDAWERWVLTLDVLRQRANAYTERADSEAPHVLTFGADLVLDGRTLPRPVNYVLARIRPPSGVKTDNARRPFIVVDPRAGHGPGIGGMKDESQIGEALAAGHPCYFIGFLPKPVPQQTIWDVVEAQARFIEAVAARHPKAQARPAVFANCQAGWQTMMMAATHPELCGPIVLAGSPLSYWAGVRGHNPLRYLGGVLGGSWLTALTGDLGAGVFDGAWLVANFEAMNLANTWWEKPYKVYANVDTEADRFLGFEAWWGNPVLLNAHEMQWIADNLFIGDRLAAGKLVTPEGLRVDLRSVASPIVVFCSRADDITPPQQALGWIPRLYGSDREIIESGQTIVYSLHETVGHLGIFVSGKVASKEHHEFTSCMDMIDLMPPGLYEAVITKVDADTAHPDLVEGDHLFRLERRTLDDVRAIVANDPEDDRRFAAAARLSEVNTGLYRTLLSPLVTAVATEAGAEAMREAHPNRLRFSVFSDGNPLMARVGAMAEEIRANRDPAPPDNPFRGLEQDFSSAVSAWWDLAGATRDRMVESMFMGVYGSPVLQAMVGLAPAEPSEPRQSTQDVLRQAETSRLRAELETRFEAGEPADAALRSLIYINLPEGEADERAFSLLKAYHEAQPLEERRSFSQLKEELKEQSLLVRLDEERAIRAVAKLLPDDPEARHAALEALHRVIEARGELSEEGRRRLARVDAIFDGAGGASPQVFHA